MSLGFRRKPLDKAAKLEFINGEAAVEVTLAGDDVLPFFLARGGAEGPSFEPRKIVTGGLTDRYLAPWIYLIPDSS